MRTEGVSVSDMSLGRRRGIGGRGLSLQDSHLLMSACALASASTVASLGSFEGVWRSESSESLRETLASSWPTSMAESTAASYMSFLCAALRIADGMLLRLCAGSSTFHSGERSLSDSGRFLNRFE